MAKEVKRITVGTLSSWLFLILSWIFGILFIIVGMAIIAQGSYISGTLIVLFSAMIIPYFNKIVSEKFHFKISGGIKFILIIVIFILMGFAISQTSNNTTDKSSSDIQPAMSIEEIKSSAVAFTYDDLMRNNDKYIGKIIYFRGKIVQVSEVYGNKYVLRVATKEEPYLGYSDNVIWVNYEGSRLLEDDIVDVWGTVKSLKSYTAVLGNKITVPDIDSKNLELVKKAEE